MQLNDVPPHMEPRMCAEETCRAIATKTVCADPTRCDDVLCCQLVACDAHADRLAAIVEQLMGGQGKFTLTPESETKREAKLAETLRERLYEYGAPDWEAEGYESFYAFWTAKELDRFTYPRDSLPTFAYQMFFERVSTEDVALAIKGIGPAFAEILKRDYDRGVPVAEAHRWPTYSRITRADLDSLSTHLT